MGVRVSVGGCVLRIFLECRDEATCSAVSSVAVLAQLAVARGRPCTGAARRGARAGGLSDVPLRGASGLVRGGGSPQGRDRAGAARVTSRSRRRTLRSRRAGRNVVVCGVTSGAITLAETTAIRGPPAQVGQKPRLLPARPPLSKRPRRRPRRRRRRRRRRWWRRWRGQVLPRRCRRDRDRVVFERW